MHQRLRRKAGFFNTIEKERDVAHTPPKRFFTLKGGNARSERILRQLEPLLKEHGAAVAVAETAEECVALAEGGVALFDGMPRKRFSPTVPSACAKSPAWAKQATWGVIIGSEAERAGCARALVGMFFHPRRTEPMATPYPWGEARVPRATGRRRRSTRTRPRGWFHAGLSS